MASLGVIPPAPQFVELCGKVQTAYSEIHISKLPAEVADWAAVIERRLSKPGHPFKIEFEGFEAVGGKEIKGQLLRYKDHAKILYSRDETFCWQRFIAAKELAHLLLDRPEDYTKQPTSLMSRLITGIPMWLLKKDPHQDEAAYQSESLALVAATEMLVPWSRRDYFRQLCDMGKDNYEIAVEFRVPKHVISNILTPFYGPLTKLANEAAAAK